MPIDNERGSTGRESTVRDFAGVLFRRFWLAAGFAGLVVALALGATLVLKKVWRSDAKMLVRIGRESVSLDPTATTGQVVSLALTRLQEVNSEIEILTSRRLAGRVVDALGPDAVLEGGAGPLRRLERLVGLEGAGGDDEAGRRRLRATESLLERLEVRAVKDSNVISAAYEADDPRRAQLVLDRLLAFFLEEHINAHHTRGSHQFFEREVVALRGELDRTERRLRDLKSASGIVALGSQREALSSRLSEVDRQFDANESARAASAARVAVLEKQFAGQPEMVLAQVNTGMAGSAVDLMRQRLYELQIEEQALLSRYTPESQPVRRIRKQIEDSRTLLEAEEARHKELRREANQVRRDLELRILAERDGLASLEAEGAVLKARREELAAELVKLNDVTMRIEQLERRQGFERTTLESYTAKMEQARIDDQLEAERISNISIVQPATLPEKPVRPKKSVILVLALLLGLSGGIGLAFVTDRLDRSFHSPQDVERVLGVPVLAAVPLSGEPVVLLDAPTIRDGLGGPPTVLELPAGPAGAPEEPGDGPAGGWERSLEVRDREQDADSGPDAAAQADEAEPSPPAGAEAVLVADAPPPGPAPRIEAAPPARPSRREPDAYDELRDELMILQGWSLPAAFGVLGTSGGEGASTVATNLAVKLAGSGDGPGLLVDCSLERPAIHEMFDLPQSPGLGELEGGRITDVPMISSPVPHLDVLPAGRSGRFIPMTQRLAALEVLLAEWRKRYRFVVLDLPPVCAAGSALRMAALLDGAVLVVEAGRSRHESVERARQLLDKAKVRTVGVVLNKRRFPVPRWLYDRL